MSGSPGPWSGPDHSQRIHVLKIHPGALVAVQGGRKRAEFRRDDRGVQVGDFLELVHWAPDEEGPAITPQDGRSRVLVRVTHAVRGGDFGIPEGFAMFSVELVP